ncbi:glutamate-cysteine ligase-domain-containing protein [Obelidium mucronatum]|nr:glutamate-cysteine ligase-domain-containing protein [Obelidium mucronatum]
MGLLTLGTPLAWGDAQGHAAHVRRHGIAQFLHVWAALKTRRRDKLLWGDEIEYAVVAFDDAARAHDVLLRLEAREAAANGQISWSFKPEYGRYMLEGTPAGPYGFLIEDLLAVEPNMRERRALAQSYLKENEALVSITNFPLLGVNQPSSFLDPPSSPTPSGGASNSLFIPDEAINPHPRFRTLTQNIRERRGSKVAINVPIFKDVNTPVPFLEPAPPCLVQNGENKTLPELVPDAKPDHIYMDCMCFGMGCSCLQVTFQACSVEEARRLYDQLAVMTPIMMALSAGAPIFRGYLADVDCRWDVISGSVDDRTREERGLDPLKSSRFNIPKSRYASISTYLSPGPLYSGGCSQDPDVFSPMVTTLPPPKDTYYDAKYNDIPLVHDKDIYKELTQNGIDDLLAKHYAHLFIRDPIVVFTEKLDLDDSTSTDHFENIQSTNWQTMRFKPPPPLSPIGWRVEFRSMEIQLTDFENAAYSVFVVLLTRTILSFDLNLYMKLSLVDLNMATGQKRDAVLKEKFWFRKNVFGNPARRPAEFDGFAVAVPSVAAAAAAGDSYDDAVELTVDEIINGKANEFPGMVPLIRAYLSAAPNLSYSTLKGLNEYLDFISRRAAGKIPTGARWIRNFVMGHPEYKGDSVVSQSVAYDLMKKVDELGKTAGRVAGYSL